MPALVSIPLMLAFSFIRPRAALVMMSRGGAGLKFALASFATSCLVYNAVWPDNWLSEARLSRLVRSVTPFLDALKLSAPAAAFLLLLFLFGALALSLVLFGNQRRRIVGLWVLQFAAGPTLILSAVWLSLIWIAKSPDLVLASTAAVIWA